MMCWLISMCAVCMTHMQFAKMHQEKGRSVLLTAQQEEWLTIQRMIADTNLQVSADNSMSCALHGCHGQLGPQLTLAR
jgi:hypothetical protein